MGTDERNIGRLRCLERPVEPMAHEAVGVLDQGEVWMGGLEGRNGFHRAVHGTAVCNQDFLWNAVEGMDRGEELVEVRLFVEGRMMTLSSVMSVPISLL